MEGDPTAISTGMVALNESLLETGINKLLSDILGSLPLLSVSLWA